MRSDGRTVSEWEDSVLFDADDPDFSNLTANGNGILSSNPSLVATTATERLHMLNTLMRKVPSTMSVASVQAPHLAELCSSIGRSSLSVSSSVSDLVGSPFEISADNVLTIEDLRMQMGSCFTCGVSWAEDHVSLDCSECGGYGLERPCPLCDGNCGSTWKRDFTMSHASGKARWQGSCPSHPISYPPSLVLPTIVAPAAVPPTCGATRNQFLAQELCARLEKLSTQT
ncbi:protein pinocchio [Lutzomyia longipalpis]|nr:protein pinocchio [Lutzomyia longipalpis]XP_055685252.1 protein pinocchio [Lutzomyia longipalpis]